MNTTLNPISNSTLICEEKAFKLYLLPDAILHYEYFDEQVIQLADVQRAFELYELNGEANTRKVLLSFGQYASISTEARLYSEKIEMHTPAQAIIIQNLAHRILARFYHIFRKDNHPLKFFSDKKSAIEWLNHI